MRKKYYAITGGALAAGVLVIALLVTSGLESMMDIFAVMFYGMATYLGVTEALMRLLDKPLKQGDFKICTYDKTGNCTVRNYR